MINDRRWIVAVLGCWALLELLIYSGAAEAQGLAGVVGSRAEPRATVPINVNTIANGTANQPIPRIEPRRPHRRGRIFRPIYPLVIVRDARAPTVIEARDGRVGTRRGLAGVDGASRRSFPERGRSSGRLPSLEAIDALDPDRPERPSTATPAAPGGSPVAASVVVPIVVPPDSSGRTGAAPVSGGCALIRVKTPGGIEWRHRASLSALGVDSPGAASARLQEIVTRGEVIELVGPDGSFRIPSTLVRGLIVGPCRR